MYKVFIENKPIIFRINPQMEDSINSKLIRAKIRTFLYSGLPELTIDITDKKDFKRYFRDYKKIEAAGGLVQRGDGFLFIKRNGKWDIPKGKLEKGETPKEGGIREIEEECGLLSPIIKKKILTTYHTYEHKGRLVLKKTYWYWLLEGPIIKELVPQLEEGITELAFFKMEDFESIKNNTYLSIIEVVDAMKLELESV